MSFVWVTDEPSFSTRSIVPSSYVMTSCPAELTSDFTKSFASDTSASVFVKFQMSSAVACPLPISFLINFFVSRFEKTEFSAAFFTSFKNASASLLLRILLSSLSYLSNMFFNFSSLISSRRIPPLILDKSTFSPFLPNLNSSDIIYFTPITLNSTRCMYRQY